VRTRYRVHLNYEDSIRVTGHNESGLLIHDDRYATITEQKQMLIEMCDLVAGDESEKLFKTLGYMFDNFEMRGIEFDIQDTKEKL